MFDDYCKTGVYFQISIHLAVPVLVTLGRFLIFDKLQSLDYNILTMKHNLPGSQKSADYPFQTKKG